MRIPIFAMPSIRCIMRKAFYVDNQQFMILKSKNSVRVALEVSTLPASNLNQMELLKTPFSCNKSVANLRDKLC